MSLSLQIEKMKKEGCRYCEHLINVSTSSDYIVRCEYSNNPATCTTWQIAKCMIPDNVTKVFPAQVWEEIRDAIDALLQLDVRYDAHSITAGQFALLERNFICPQ